MKTSLSKSQAQEKRLAKTFGGQTNSGSGNGWIRKNDVRTDDLSIEAKYTDAKQFTLKNADLITAEKYALIDGRDSVFMISFSGRDEWAVIRSEEFEQYRNLKQELADLKAAYQNHLEYSTHPRVFVVPEQSTW